MHGVMMGSDDVFYSTSVLAAYDCTAVHAITGHRLARAITAISDVLEETALLYMSLQTDTERPKDYSQYYPYSHMYTLWAFDLHSHISQYVMNGTRMRFAEMLIH